VSHFRQNATRAGIARPAPVTLRGSCCAGATRSIAGGTSSRSRRRTGPAPGGGASRCRRRAALT